MKPFSIFDIHSEGSFQEIALCVFDFQYRNNSLYRSFCDYLKRNPKNVSHPNEIPFLPISFFKSHRVYSSTKKEDIVFTSSATTGTSVSQHFVKDLSLYRQSYLRTFEWFYNNPEDFVILALLPSYLERKGSSLITMVDDLIQLSHDKDSGFYLHNLDTLAQRLTEIDQRGKKVLLIGVSFALLDLVEKHQFSLKNTIIMETGGMKGRRKELIREELHSILCKGFGVEKIHSEYGMTELLSQAYSKGDGIFHCPPWMKILIRDAEDALTLLPSEKTGGINVIDLANLYSCSFIATQDLGKAKPNEAFEILGRFDNSDIRGCNLMVY